jgi:hypothetical protein
MYLTDVVSVVNPAGSLLGVLMLVDTSSEKHCYRKRREKTVRPSTYTGVGRAKS